MTVSQENLWERIPHAVVVRIASRHAESNFMRVVLVAIADSAADLLSSYDFKARIPQCVDDANGRNE